MAKETGRDARVNGVVCTGHFEIDTQVKIKPVWCSDSAGGAILWDSVQDWTAEIMAFGHTPGVVPGELFQFEGMTNSGVGWQSGATGAFVERFELTVPSWPETEEADTPIFYTLNVGGNGALTPNATLSKDALVVPTPATGLGRALTLGGTAVTGCLGMKLVAECMPAKWGDTDVAGWFQRDIGGWNAAVLYRVNLDGISNIPAVNTDLVVTVPVTASTSWAINWMRVLRRRPVYDQGARTGKPKMVAMDVLLGWNSVKTGVQGWIKTPAGAALWPESTSSGA